LQVEHPVTEEISGLDLVEWQLKVACGEPLSFTQEVMKKDGHAIEVRIYAENPKTFYPSPGTIETCVLPIGNSIRHEAAIENGTVVSPFYDPMIAKMIVKEPTREQAIETLTKALLAYKVTGIQTNIPMLIDVVKHEAFKQGKTTTNFVEEHFNKQLN